MIFYEEKLEVLGTASKLITAVAIFQIYLQEKGDWKRITKIRSINEGLGATTSYLLSGNILYSAYWSGVRKELRSLFPSENELKKFLRSGAIDDELCSEAV